MLFRLNACKDFERFFMLNRGIEQVTKWKRPYTNSRLYLLFLCAHCSFVPTVPVLTCPLCQMLLWDCCAFLATIQNWGNWLGIKNNRHVAIVSSTYQLQKLVRLSFATLTRLLKQQLSYLNLQLLHISTFL